MDFMNYVGEMKGVVHSAIDYHFSQNETHVLEYAMIPSSEIENSNAGYPVAPGVYPVIFEDAEIIAVLID